MSPYIDTQAAKRFSAVVVCLSMMLAMHQPTMGQTADPPDERPNILLLLSEDQGRELGCYGDPIARTPNIDRLAGEGVRFDNAYVVQAGCSPSRAALLTGLYPHQNGQIGLATHRMRLYSESTPNLPALLKAHGYHTALIGKLHINPEQAFPFDTRVSIESFNNRDVQTVAKEAAAVFGMNDRPFFLQISYADTHSPFVPRKSDGGLPAERHDPAEFDTLPMLGYSSPTIRQTLATYYDCISRLDSGVGMVLDALEASGKADNTLVIFMSDHGPQMMRGKMSCYEGGLRVPMIIRFPGGLAAGTSRDELISELDLAPTILALAGTDSPPHWPGLSILPLVHGNDTAWRDLMFTEFTLHWPVTYYPQRAVRDGRYKLIHNMMPESTNPVCEVYLNEKHVPTITPADLPDLPPHPAQAVDRFRNPPEYELYDLQEDPWEYNNLADAPEHAEIVSRLQGELQRWRVATDDPLRHADVLKRFTAEVAATFTGPVGGYEHVGRKQDFRWSYPEYFVASMSQQTRQALGLEE